MINQTEGKYHQAEGGLKEHAGEAAHDHAQQIEGTAEKESGKAEDMIAAMAERMWGDEQPQR
jgi:uncharacterized protein YjbJ (UPF0337 family)